MASRARSWSTSLSEFERNGKRFLSRRYSKPRASKPVLGGEGYDHWRFELLEADFGILFKSKSTGLIIYYRVVGKCFVCSKVVGISKVVGTVKSEYGQACTSGT